MSSGLINERFVLGGEELRLVIADPIPAGSLDEAARRIGWPLPDDYRSFLAAHGPADVFGAQLIEPAAWQARSEPLDESPAGRMANFLPFARKPLPDGEMLFCFRFELALGASAKDIAAFSAGEPREVFHNAPYEVVACHLPRGLGGARLNEGHRAVASSFSGWIEQIVAMLRARSSAG